jgi:hypothetical protein
MVTTFGYSLICLNLQIVLPYSKIATIDLIKSESSLDAISIKMLEDSETKDIAEEYYFSYFNNVQGAYDKMIVLWQNGRDFPALKSRQSIYDTSIPATRALSLDADGLDGKDTHQGIKFEYNLTFYRYC